MNSSGSFFGIRRRKMVVVEGKNPGEQEEVFVHLSCPVPSIMSHSRALSIQPAAQVACLINWTRVAFVLHDARLPHEKVGGVVFERSRGGERTHVNCYVHFSERRRPERTHDDCGFHVLERRRPARTSL